MARQPEVLDSRAMAVKPSSEKSPPSDPCGDRVVVGGDPLVHGTLLSGASALVTWCCRGMAALIPNLDLLEKITQGWEPSGNVLASSISRATTTVNVA